MRIISQNKKVDIPYERAIIVLEEDRCNFYEDDFVITAKLNGHIYDMGVYKTEYRALDIIEAIRETYLDYIDTMTRNIRGHSCSVKDVLCFYMPQE